jgi:hypothetical protein
MFTASIGLIHQSTIHVTSPPITGEWVGVVPGLPPSTEIDPALGCKRPTERWSSLVFPAPFGPTSPTTLPDGIARVHSESAHLRP